MTRLVRTIRTNRLSVACVVDHDMLRAINTGNSSHNRARYDLSVVQTLRGLCRAVHVVGAFEDSSRTIDELRRLKPDAVFNLAFSAHPLEAAFAGCLDVLGMAYTGSGLRGIALANDKIRSRRLLHSAGILVPRFVELSPGSAVAVEFDPPYIVKPTSLAGSAGIYADSVVDSVKDVSRLAKRIWRCYDVPAMCDEFVVGREFRVGMIEDADQGFNVAGITEWKFGSAVPGWGFKTEAIRLNRKVRQARQVTRSLVPKSDRASHALTAIARGAVKALDIRGYASVDVRMNEEGHGTVLEANANPGLWSGSAIWSNPSFEASVKRILNFALQRPEP
jgi:D-alanine-D-alanine ligase